MKKIVSSVFAYLSVFMLPAVVFAQSYAQNSGSSGSGDLGGISEIFNKIIGFINNTLIPLVFAVALLAFLYGVFQYFILGGGDESKQEEGKGLMLYAIVGFVLMVSIFGIVNLVANGLGLSSTGADAQLNIPSVPTR